MAKQTQSVIGHESRKGSKKGKERPEAEKAYHFGLNISKLREARNLTQGALAERCNIDRSSIARIESDAQMPKAETILQICDALQVSPNMIFPERLTQYERTEHAVRNQKLEALEARLQMLSPEKAEKFYQFATIFLDGLQSV